MQEFEAHIVLLELVDRHGMDILDFELYSEFVLDFIVLVS